MAGGIVFDPAAIAGDWQVLHFHYLSDSGGNVLKIADANPHRIAIYFSMSGGGSQRWNVFPDNTVNNGQGFLAATSGGASSLNYNKDGGLAQVALYARANGQFAMDTIEVLFIPLGSA